MATCKLAYPVHALLFCLHGLQEPVCSCSLTVLAVVGTSCQDHLVLQQATALSMPVLYTVDDRVESLQREYERAQAEMKENEAAQKTATKRAQAERARAEAAESKLAALFQEADRTKEKVVSLEQDLAGIRTATE